MPKRDFVRRVHPHAWLWEGLEGDPRCEVRPMFGGRALYFEGRLRLFFCAKEEPWRGVCVCTDRERQAALTAEWPELAPHPVLPKWLYLSEGAAAFERVATRLVERVRARDPRIGVEPGGAGKKKRAAPRRGGRPGKA